MKKYFLVGLFSLAIILVVVIIFSYIYKRDKNKFEPRLWIGFFDYRLNFRDVGQSLNQCLKKEVFQTGLVYRSNRYFSGWSCDKIHNPDKIYSLNYSPWHPHAYYCEQNNNRHLTGFHPNTTFEISDIEQLSNWQRPEFKNSLCVFFKETLNDLVERKSFLVHCDMGRDRTGAFTAMFTMMLAEEQTQTTSFATEEMQDAIECDYEKTHSLEKEKIGRMKNFLKHMEKQGGVSQFIENECGIDKKTMKLGAENFFK
ncbi:MAG: tyrosine-protein phosphatase [Bdellovibrionota bacterium]